MSLAILFHLLCAQHVSDINISIFRSLRLCWWITTSVVLFSVRCMLELLPRLVFGGVHFAGWSTDVVIHQHSRKLLKMDILMSETCWAHKKWNKLASDIKLVFHSSTIAMLHGPINIRFTLQRDQRITGTKADDTPGQSKGVFFTILKFVKDVLSPGNSQLVLSAKISCLSNENVVRLVDSRLQE